MLQIATPVWNRVAKHNLRTEWARAVFPMDDEGQQEAYEKVESSLLKQGHPELAVGAYLSVMPLLAEREAIQRAQQEQYEPALTEVLSVQEAVALASRDWALNERTISSLRQLLQGPLPPT